MTSAAAKQQHPPRIRPREQATPPLPRGCCHIIRVHLPWLSDKEPISDHAKYKLLALILDACAPKKKGVPWPRWPPNSTPIGLPNYSFAGWQLNQSRAFTLATAARLPGPDFACPASSLLRTSWPACNVFLVKWLTASLSARMSVRLSTTWAVELVGKSMVSCCSCTFGLQRARLHTRIAAVCCCTVHLAGVSQWCLARLQNE